VFFQKTNDNASSEIIRTEQLKIHHYNPEGTNK